MGHGTVKDSSSPTPGGTVSWPELGQGTALLLTPGSRYPPGPLAVLKPHWQQQAAELHS